MGSSSFLSQYSAFFDFARNFAHQDAAIRNSSFLSLLLAFFDFARDFDHKDLTLRRVNLAALQQGSLQW